MRKGKDEKVAKDSEKAQVDKERVIHPNLPVVRGD